MSACPECNLIILITLLRSKMCAGCASFTEKGGCGEKLCFHFVFPFDEFIVRRPAGSSPVRHFLPMLKEEHFVVANKIKPLMELGILAKHAKQQEFGFVWRNREAS